MVTTFVFDVGNVLIRWDARLVLRGVLPEEQIDPFLDEIGFHAWNLEQDRGRSWDDAMEVASRAHPQHADLIHRFHHNWHDAVPGAIDGTVEILRAMAAEAPVYAITNFSAEKWEECRKRFEFLNLFTDTVVSAHERLLKPDPAIYRRLLDRAGLSAAECLFIDDSPANVAGARDVGMQAIRFTSPEQLAADLAQLGPLS